MRVQLLISMVNFISNYSLPETTSPKTRPLYRKRLGLDDTRHKYLRNTKTRVKCIHTRVT